MDEVNRTSLLFCMPMWEIVREKPREGETVDRLYRRLRRLAKSYQRWERYFRVRRAGEVVLWQQVPKGMHTRLGFWHNVNQRRDERRSRLDQLHQVQETGRGMIRQQRWEDGRESCLSTSNTLSKTTADLKIPGDVGLAGSGIQLDQNAVNEDLGESR